MRTMKRRATRQRTTPSCSKQQRPEKPRSATYARWLAAALVLGLVTACDRLPEPLRNLVAPAPKAQDADDPVRITTTGKVLTLGCVRSSTGTCHFLVISHEPNRIEAFKVAQGQGHDIERVGRAAFYCMDERTTPDVDKCPRKKLWAELDPKPKP